MDISPAPKLCILYNNKGDYFNDWEYSFIDSVYKGNNISDKQAEIIYRLFDRLITAKKERGEELS